MGIRIKKLTVVYDSFNMKAIEPKYIFPGIDTVRRYVEDNPFPESEDCYYSEEDLVHDTQTTGMWSLPDDLTTEQKEYIVEMVNYFL
jgi:hypothetical protein